MWIRPLVTLPQTLKISGHFESYILYIQQHMHLCLFVCVCLSIRVIKLLALCLDEEGVARRSLSLSLSLSSQQLPPCFCTIALLDQVRLRHDVGYGLAQWIQSHLHKCVSVFVWIGVEWVGSTPPISQNNVQIPTPSAFY